MFGATDWVLKRLAKFLLKRTLGRLLHPDVDMDLLEVALGSGSMAMHRVLLDCDHINELLVRQRCYPARCPLACFQPLTHLSVSQLAMVGSAQ